jgi:beta-glucosidase
MGGGSAHVTPTSVSHPLAAIRDHFEPLGVEVVAARGALTYKRLPLLDPALFSSIEFEFFADVDALDHPDSVPAATGRSSTARLLWTVDPATPTNRTHRFSARARATFTPDVSGRWTIGINSIADARLYVDGVLILDNADLPSGGSFFGMGKDEIHATVDLVAGRPHELVVELRRPDTGNAMSGVQIGALPPVGDDLIGEAVAAAAGADVSIVVVGTNDDWESEGWDREHLDLPGDQDGLIEAVARVSRRTIVVVNAGSPVSMPWLESVDAVLVCWFPGQEMGRAITDVLTGAVEPQGRLPVTFPVRLEDTPAFEHHPGRNGVAQYLEGRLIGYRWYDTVGREPLFPFGFGLGYAAVSITGAEWHDGEVRVTLTNSGLRDGVEIVQLYARRPGEFALAGDEARQALVGFAKVAVGAGESVTAEVAVDARAGLTWNVETRSWTPMTGPFELAVGRSSREIAIRLPWPERA